MVTHGDNTATIPGPQGDLGDFGGEVYVVQPGDSWFSIAGDVYGNQRVAGQLMEANGGGPLHPGDKILLPPKKKDEVADSYFSKSTWRSAEVLTAQVTGGDVDAVLRAHLEEDIQDWLDGKISTEALKKKLPGVDLEMLRRFSATPAEILNGYEQELAVQQLAEALARSEYASQLLMDGDPEMGQVRDLAATIASYREMVRSGAMSLDELQGLVETTLMNNLRADLRIAQAQTAGQDAATVGRALDAVYAAHGVKSPWDGTTYEVHQAGQLLETLAQSSLAHQLLHDGDPDITAIGQVNAGRATLLAQVEAGRLTVEAVEQLVRAGILSNLRADLYITEAGLDGQSIAERGFQADAARYEAMAENWEKIAQRGIAALFSNSNTQNSSGVSRLSSALGSGTGLWEIIMVVTVLVALVFVFHGKRRHPVNYDHCTASLEVCFENNSGRQFNANEHIDVSEFNLLLDAISRDLDERIFITPWDIARAGYDPPFFTGNSSHARGSNEDLLPDTIVCIGDRCSPQSAINYVAQGIYSARSGQSLEGALDQANTWNQIMYGHEANPDELFWLQYGYEYYQTNYEE